MEVHTTTHTGIARVMLHSSMKPPLPASIIYVLHPLIEVWSPAQIFHDEDDELQEAEVENVLALQGADEDDTDSDGSDALDKSDSDASSDESDADDE